MGENLFGNKQLQKKRARKNKKRERIAYTKQKIDREAPKAKNDKKGNCCHQASTDGGGKTLAENTVKHASTVKACDGKEI